MKTPGLLFALLVLCGCGVGLEEYRISDAVTLHRYELSVSNVYLIETTEGAVLVDAGDPGQAPKILRAMKRSGVEPDDLRAIVITHAHADHTGAAKPIAHELDVPIILQQADAARARTGRNPKLPAQNLTAVFLKWFLKKKYPAYDADVAYEGCVDLGEYGVSAVVQSTPGHTPGSSIVVLPDGHVLVGDLLAGGFLGGAVAAANPESHYFQEDTTRVRDTIAWLTAETDTAVLYPGHGGPLAADRVAAELERGEFGHQSDATFESPTCPSE